MAPQIKASGLMDRAYSNLIALVAVLRLSII